MRQFRFFKYNPKTLPWLQANGFTVMWIMFKQGETIVMARGPK